MPHGAITREGFSKQVVQALLAEGVDGSFEYDALENCLVHATRPRFSLEEPFLEAQGQPQYIVDQLAQAYAHMYVHPPELPRTWEEARQVVFPYLRPMSFHAQRGFLALQGEKVDVVPYGAVTEHVTVCVGAPTKWKTLVATVPDLERWGVSLEAAFAAGRENVGKRGLPEWQKSNEHPGVFRSPWQDEYGISRILFQGTFSSLPLRGDPVIIAPTWRGVLVAGSGDPKGLVGLGIVGRAIAEKQGHLFYRPLRARGDALEHWIPPKGHEAHVALKHLHVLNECGDYASQAQIARRFLERQEKASNIPVPQVAVFGGGADVGSIATWREGPPCALPQVDYVIFKKKFQDVGAAKWEDVQRVLGSELEPLHTNPPRWLGRTFPADWQFANMGVVPWNFGPG